MAVLVALAVPGGMRAATASALVSATVLGPAETEIASGAVALSRIAGSAGSIVVARSGRTESAAFAQFEVRGGFNAAYTIALPEAVTAMGRDGEIRVSGFRTQGGVGILSRDGSARVGVSAAVSVPAGRAPGPYAASYPVTIAYN
jgi:hypothetical protein